MVVCGLSPHLGSSESRKTQEQKFIFCFLVTIFPAQLHFLHVNPHKTHNSSNRSNERLTLETSAFKLFTAVNLRFQLIW